MGSNYHGYGIEVLSNMLSGRECCRSARFPRVTMCDFEIRTMADHIHKHTIQVKE
jgi:innexin